MNIKNWSILSLMVGVALLTTIFISIGTLSKDIPFIKYSLYGMIITLVSITLIYIDIKKVATVQIVYTIISIFYLEALFQLLKLDVPFEMLYFSDLISLIIILKLLNNRILQTLHKDPFLVIIGFVIIGGFISIILNGGRLVDFVNGVRIYFRYIPLYIVFSNYEIHYKSLYKNIYISNIALFSMEILINAHQDFRNGIFGMLGAFSFVAFITFYLAYALVAFLNGEINLYKFIFVLVLNSVLLALAEHKAAILIMYLFISIIIILKRGDVIKRMFTIFLAGFGLVAAMRLMVYYFPKFALYSDLKTIIPYAIEHYFLGNSNQVDYDMGRFEAMSYISGLEHNNIFEKIFGNGLGSSIPQERWFYFSSKESYQSVIDFPMSQLFEKYGTNIGYHLSSFAYIFIDGGYASVIICILLLIIWFNKGLKLFNHGTSLEQKAIGSIGIFIVIWVLYSCGYGSQLIFPNTGLTLMTTLGVIQFNYTKCKQKNIY